MTAASPPPRDLQASGAEGALCRLLEGPTLETDSSRLSSISVKAFVAHAQQPSSGSANRASTGRASVGRMSTARMSTASSVACGV